MRLLRSLIYSLLFSIIFLSCQKELNYTIENNSTGTLKADDATSECLETSVLGIYKANTPLAEESAIYVLVNVVTTGKYLILSDTINGYSFSGTGNFGNVGPNLVKLNAKGTPEQEGINTFKISYGESSCFIDVEVVGASSSTEAVYTLGGNGSTCSGAVVAGTNQQSLPFSSQNTVTLNLSVTVPGTYSISTGSLNGVAYNASGSFSGGENTVTLIGTGTPVSAGTVNYTVTGGGNSCTFSVTFDPPPGPAVFTLGGAPDVCINARQGGIYTAGVAVNATNTDTINVKVTSVGSYTINSNTKNGVTYAASGVFTTTGVQDVVLYAQGTPVENGNFTYTVTVDGNSCNFDVSTDYIVCKIDGVFSTFNINASWGVGNLTGLSIDGYNNANNNIPSISLRVLKSNNNYTPDTYTTVPAIPQTTVSCDYNDAAGLNYYTTTGLSNPFTIVITKITDKRVDGAFFGTLKDNGGIGTNQREITEGLFSVPRN